MSRKKESRASRKENHPPTPPKSVTSEAIAIEAKYWFLKMNPETWQIEHLEPGEETFLAAIT